MAHTDLGSEATTLVVEGCVLSEALGAALGARTKVLQGSVELPLALPCLIPLTWEVTVGPGHPGDARLGSAFRVAAEASVLRRVGEEAAVFAVDPGREDGGTYTEGAGSGRISCHVVSSPILVQRRLLKVTQHQKVEGQAWLCLAYFCPTVWPAHIICPSPNKHDSEA